MSAGRKIKVLQLIKGLDIGGVNGGAERFSIDLAQSLPADQYEVSICAFFKQGTPTEQRWLDQIKQDGIDVFFASHWAGNNNFRSYLQGITQLNNFLRRHPYDICHSHFQLGTVAALYFKMTGSVRHAIRTAHIAFEWEKGWYGWLRRQVFSKWIFPIFLDAEVGVSQAIVDGLRQYPGVKLSRRQPNLIYNAIHLDGLLEQENQVQPVQNKDKWIVGTVGRLAEQKGHIFLLEAVK
ncbi:MAG TPA: glycosyltransferase, partial [Pseudomonadales bacterium]|nr:glycosyltransferase [Pseudomonadales bacterium]